MSVSRLLVLFFGSSSVSSFSCVPVFFTVLRFLVSRLPACPCTTCSRERQTLCAAAAWWKKTRRADFSAFSLFNQPPENWPSTARAGGHAAESNSGMARTGSCSDTREEGGGAAGGVEPQQPKQAEQQQQGEQPRRAGGVSEGAAAAPAAVAAAAAGKGEGGGREAEAEEAAGAKRAAAEYALEFLALTKDGAEVYRYDLEALAAAAAASTPTAAASTSSPGREAAAAGVKDPVRSFDGVEHAVWLAEGERLLLCGRRDPNSVDVVSVATGEKIFSCRGNTPVQRVAVSPLQTSLLVCYRHHEQLQPQNCCMYTAAEGQQVAAFTLKNLSHTAWPPLRWTSMETCCCRMVRGEALHIFYKGAFDFYHPAVRVACEGVVAFSMCNEKRRTARGAAVAEAPAGEQAAAAGAAAPSPAATPAAASKKGKEKGTAATPAGGGRRRSGVASAGPAAPAAEAEEDAGGHKRQDDAAAEGKAAATKGQAAAGEGKAAAAEEGAGAAGPAGGGGGDGSGGGGKDREDSRQPPLACAAYIAGKNGSPACIKLFDLLRGGELLCSRSFYQGGEATFKWSYDGRALLALVHSDATDKSYYGSDSLYFFKADGSYSCQLVCADEGPIQDVAWSPTTLEFVLCRGPTPPEVLLYDGSKSPSGPKLSFGRLMSNTLRWDPFSRVVLTGGFGNMAGDVSLWHKAQRKLLAKTTARFSVICDFTADGLHFLTATTSPRLRVDNCLSLYSLSGRRLLRLDFACLYNVLMRPVTPAVSMQLQQQQSKALQQMLAAADTPAGGGATAAAAAGGSAAAAAPAAPKIYRPPGASAAWESHARQSALNQSGSLSVVGARSSRSIPGLPPGAAGARYPPGYAPPSAAAGQSSSKGKKKKK